MENRPTSIFVTKFREKTDKKGGQYLIGSLGLATVILRPHRTNEGEWNMTIMEGKKREDRPGEQGSSAGGYGQAPQGFDGPASTYGDDEIPF